MEQARRVAPSQHAGERNLSEVPEAHIAQIHARTLVRLVAILCTFATLLLHGQKKVEYIQRLATIGRKASINRVFISHPAKPYKIEEVQIL